jgi:quinol-cytochrome oxidoreductase complex cytochrome b subunit
MFNVLRGHLKIKIQEAHLLCNGVYSSVAQMQDNFAFHLFIVACLILYNVLLHFIKDVCGTHYGGGYVGVKGYLVTVTKKRNFVFG